MLSCLGLGETVEVRLDTGDRRFLFWGVPVALQSLPSEPRERLVSLQDPDVPKEWTWCATQVGTNHADAMVYGFYKNAAAWVEVDPEIAKLMVRDIAEYLQTTHGTHGLPGCAILWPVVERDEEGRRHIVEDWQKNENVQYYLKSKGYTVRR